MNNGVENVYVLANNRSGMRNLPSFYDEGTFRNSRYVLYPTTASTEVRSNDPDRHIISSTEKSVSPDPQRVELSVGRVTVVIPSDKEEYWPHCGLGHPVKNNPFQHVQATAWCSLTKSGDVYQVKFGHRIGKFSTPGESGSEIFARIQDGVYTSRHYY